MARAAAGRRNFRIHTKRRCMIKKKKKIRARGAASASPGAMMRNRGGPASYRINRQSGQQRGGVINSNP